MGIAPWASMEKIMTVKIKLTALAATLAAAMMVTSPTLAQQPTTWNQGGGEQDEALHLTPDRENGIEVYEVCAACHLYEGWGQIGRASCRERV